MCRKTGKYAEDGWFAKRHINAGCDRCGYQKGQAIPLEYYMDPIPGLVTVGIRQCPKCGGLIDDRCAGGEE